MICGNGFDPDRLPQAGKLRELASRHAFIGVVKIDENFMRLAGRAGWEFVRDSLEATFLRAELNAIEIEGGFRANGFAMEEDFFASPVIRNLDRFAIPSTIIGFRQTTREGLRGRGNQRFFGKAIGELRRHRTVAQKIPLSVEIFPCRTGHRWPRIFRQRRGQEKILRPARLKLLRTLPSQTMATGSGQRRLCHHLAQKDR